jgi:conjugal transfer pilus assembly protein TraB
MNEISPTNRARRKQYLLLAGVLIGIMAIASVGVYFTSDSAPAPGVTRKSDIKTKSYIAPGEKVDPQDAWRGVSDSRLTSMEAKLTVLENENRILNSRLSGGGAAAAAAAAAGGKSPEQMSDTDLDRRLSEYEKSVDKPKTGYPGGTPSAPVAGQAPTRAPQAPPGQAAAPQGPKGAVLGGRHDGQPYSGGILTVKMSRPVDAARNGSASALSVPDQKGNVRTAQNYLPAGMFGHAKLLSGLDAPTGGQAQSNPHPVLLQLMDLAILPNQYRYDWAKCLIVGAGYGELSSERAYIRTESLSCVSKDGKVLDVPIKGFIAGEDGKAGMRGRLVSKQGQVLGNALLAGVVSGIGTGLERSSTIQSVSPLGSTSSIKPGQEFQSGIGAGVGRALDRLANYYIQLAEKMFPVIEIDADRSVDVVLTQGVTVDVESKPE